MRLNLVRLTKSLRGKTILITGANEGMGFQAALSLACRDAKIIMADYQDMTQSKRKIAESSGNSNIIAKYVDFRSLSSVRHFAQELNKEEERLDVLINNAGVFCLGKERTHDGLVATMQVNHFSPFLLTHLLLRLLRKSAPSRVIFTSSVCAFWNSLTLENLNSPTISTVDSLNSLLIYHNSKLCNIIASNGFAKRLRNSGVTFNASHPGMTGTEFLLGKKSPLGPLLKFFIKRVENGAQTNIFMATSPLLNNDSGKFYMDLKEHQQPRITSDEKFCEAIWASSKYFVGLTQEELNSVKE